MNLTVPNLTIACMIVSCVIAFGLPVSFSNVLPQEEG